MVGATKPKMSKVSLALLVDFDECAKSWGWTQDQGSGNSVDACEADYNRAKAALHAHVARLDSEVRRLKAKGGAR